MNNKGIEDFDTKHGKMSSSNTNIYPVSHVSRLTPDNSLLTAHLF
jgi:hypothetical protein